MSGQSVQAKVTEADKEAPTPTGERAEDLSLREARDFSLMARAATGWVSDHALDRIRQIRVRRRQIFHQDDFVSGEYYTDEKAGDVSMWGGEAAAAAGLTGRVSQEAFSKILSGELPTGERVDVREGRRPGFDLTFSAPKSVSVMAYIAGDKRILGPGGAQTNAVQKTMAWVEKNLAAGRVTADGKTTSVKTASLVYALLQHDTSRALDPQAHIHAIVADMTKMPDGKCQALDAQKIWATP